MSPTPRSPLSRRLRLVLLALAAAPLAACASGGPTVLGPGLAVTNATLQSEIGLFTAVTTLSSEPPGADVYEGDRLLGKTPLLLIDKSFTTETAGGRLVSLRRDGYHKVWLWFPDGIRGLTLSVNMQPFFIKDEPVAAAREVREIRKTKDDALAAQLLDVQAALVTGSRDATADVDALAKEHSGLASVRYLEALAKLKQGQKDPALELLRNAAAAAPTEPEYAVLYRQAGGDPAQLKAAPEPAPEAAAPAAGDTEGDE